MPLEFKMVTLCNLILDIFNILIHKFQNISADGTDQMIMMRNANLTFITGTAISNFHLTCKTIFYQDIHGSVYSSPGHMNPLQFQCQINFFAFPVTMIFDNLFKNGYTLRSIFKTLPAQDIPELI